MMEAKTRVLLRKMISSNILEYSSINKEYLAEEIARRWSRL